MSGATSSTMPWSNESLEGLLTERIDKRIETHLSVVALTETLAFKFKKPLRYPFVDYSTFQKRWDAACNEIYLNRRLTADVYLGVRLVALDSGAYRWKGDLIQNPPVIPPCPISERYDVAVIMKRLNEETFLSNLVSRNRVGPTDIELLAQRLLEFHSSVTVDDVDVEKYLDELKENVWDNFRALSDKRVVKLLGAPYSTVLAHSQKFIESFFQTHRSLLAERASNGYLVNGHGDLRLEHIAFENVEDSSKQRIQIFDCIEFNYAIRRNDLASEVGFLSMDLEYLKRRDLAKVLEAAYFKGKASAELVEILLFFKHYRAMVRAKVHALRALQLESGPSAQRNEPQLNELCECCAYISLSSRYACGFTGPILICVCGVTGTGKSSLAQFLKSWLYADAPNSDVIRKQTLEANEAVAARSLEYGAGIYSTSATEATYAELFKMAAEALKNCNPIILDASFLKKSHRQEAGRIARQFGAKFVIVECVLDKAVNLARLNKRLLEKNSISDGRPEILEGQIHNWEQVMESECDLHIQLDMDNSLAQLAQDVITRISLLNIAQPGEHGLL